MKRICSVLFALIFVSLSVFGAFAATRQDVVDFAYESIPEKYPVYHIWAENILGQYDLSEEEWDAVLKIVEGLVSVFPEDKGQSMHSYTKEQRAAAMAALNDFCDLTGSTYMIRQVANPKHKGDEEVLLYRADGVLVATIDGDLYPDVTGTVDGTLLLCLSGVFALSALAVVALRRKAFQA
ncbi:MAG: hypothetical protein II328_01175 [Clostridia bacterium]|nr:hypothetical protein [Clostridia bacterium]